MTYKIGPKGQVVLPRAIRERLGLEPGDEVVVELEGDHVEIRRVADIRALRGLAADAPGSLTEALEADHRWEIAHDERRYGRDP